MQQWIFTIIVAKNRCSRRELNPQLALRRRLLYPFNYENKCILQTNTTLHPDVSFETSANHRLTDEVIFVYTHAKYYIITWHFYAIYFFICNDIFFFCELNNISQHAVLVTFNAIWHEICCYDWKNILVLDSSRNGWV